MATSLVKPDELPAAVDTSPRALIAQALRNGGDPVAMAGVIKELVALEQSIAKFEWEREERQLRQEFDAAHNACQAAIGRVKPNQKRNDTSSWWADYARLDEVVRPIYTSHGFAITFSEVPPIQAGKVRIEGKLARKGVEKIYHAEITPSTEGPRGGAMATKTDAPEPSVTC